MKISEKYEAIIQAYQGLVDPPHLLKYKLQLLKSTYEAYTAVIRRPPNMLPRNQEFESNKLKANFTELERDFWVEYERVRNSRIEDARQAGHLKNATLQAWVGIGTLIVATLSFIQSCQNSTRLTALEVKPPSKTIEAPDNSPNGDLQFAPRIQESPLKQPAGK